MSESYKHRLINFEVQPPPEAWSYISEELIASRELITVSNRLFDYEVPSPPNTWNGIITSLKKNKTGEKRKNKSLYYVMAAAAIAGVIVIGILYFARTEVLNDKLANNSSSRINNKKTQPGETIAKPLPLTNNPGTEEIKEASPATISKTSRSYIVNSKALQNTKVKNSFFPGNELQVPLTAKPIRGSNGEIIQNTEIFNNPDSKYISITSPNGQQTKISSKFLNMLLFINDDNDIDQVEGYFDKNFLESLIWKSRFQDWREKIINTSFVPSSTNFMDILDLKDLITKEK